MRRHLLCGFVSLVLFSAHPFAGLAQVYHATLVGIVSDSSGAVVPGARVEALEVATNVTAGTTVEANGDYRISQLRPGVYRVQIEATGF